VQFKEYAIPPRCSQLYNIGTSARDISDDLTPILSIYRKHGNQNARILLVIDVQLIKGFSLPARDRLRVFVKYNYFLATEDHSRCGGTRGPAHLNKTVHTLLQVKINVVICHLSLSGG